MAELNKGVYDTGKVKVYVTSDNFMWEYKWIYYDNYSGSEEAYILAYEYRTNTSFTFPLSGKSIEATNEIIEKLDERTELLKS